MTGGMGSVLGSVSFSLAAFLHRNQMIKMWILD